MTNRNTFFKICVPAVLAVVIGWASIASAQTGVPDWDTALYLHNVLRGQVGSGPVGWDDTLRLVRTTFRTIKNISLQKLRNNTQQSQANFSNQGGSVQRSIHVTSYRPSLGAFLFYFFIHLLVLRIPGSRAKRN